MKCSAIQLTVILHAYLRIPQGHVLEMVANKLLDQGLVTFSDVRSNSSLSLRGGSVDSIEVN